ncbi:MAG TPA: hypothetical protein VGY55_02635, partial [Pirellulales bacterium]|nr:hypothetical protein [Pirellulales bacterium]
MYEGFRIVAVTPAGRRRYLELLTSHTSAARGLLDEHQLWLNTNDRGDIAFVRSLAARDSFFRAVDCPQHVAQLPPNSARIHAFFPECCDSATIYIRFDDDIVYIAPDAIQELLDCRLEHLRPPIVYANTVNNAICSHLHQRFGLIDYTRGTAHYDCCCQIGWRSGPFAELAHRSFLRALASESRHRFKMPNWDLWAYERVSINCIAWFGRDFAPFGGHIGFDDEVWLAEEHPRIEQRPNLICGSALVGHFAFYTQRDYLDAT